MAPPRFVFARARGFSEKIRHVFAPPNLSLQVKFESAFSNVASGLNNNNNVAAARVLSSGDCLLF
jgi:hypothetical protein